MVLLLTARTHHASLAADLSHSSVRIVNRNGDEQSIGSGTLVERLDGCGLVLTCAHLFDDGQGDLIVYFRHGTPQRAVVVAVDDANDLATLLVAKPPVRPAPMAARVPERGEELASCGFGQEGEFLINRGESQGRVTLEDGHDEGVIELRGAARQGDSGGGIYDERGQLVGVIFGSDGKVVDGTHCEVFRRFLAAHPVSALNRQQLRSIASRPLDDVASLFRPRFDGPQSKPAAKPEPTRLTTIRGAVRFRRETVPGAKIQLTGPTPHTATVDAAGRFEFKDLVAGHYELEASKSIHSYHRSAKQDLWVDGDATARPIDVQLE